MYKQQLQNSHFHVKSVFLPSLQFSGEGNIHVQKKKKF